MGYGYGKNWKQALGFFFFFFFFIMQNKAVFMLWIFFLCVLCAKDGERRSFVQQLCVLAEERKRAMGKNV